MVTKFNKEMAVRYQLCAETNYRMAQECREDFDAMPRLTPADRFDAATIACDIKFHMDRAALFAAMARVEMGIV